MNYVRRLVSGDKARFTDDDLNLELDLVYLTDQIIIMGYPAEGVEGWYRNRRQDAVKFLEHRHGNNFWVFNFCPARENSYDKSVFGGRVSRYPFPDHHAPPLVYMALVAREMRSWLSGSPDRVAVLHCKAGKGRSGTMACSYLLSLEDRSSPPKLQRSYTAKEWARLRADEVMTIVPDDPSAISNDATNVKTEGASSFSAASKGNHPESLNTILDLHSSRRMKRPSSPSKKAKHGVSIPSQRRWLYYWALLLSHTAPQHVWPILPTPSPKVQLTQMKLRMRPVSSTTASLARAASVVLERAKGAKNAPEHKNAHVWASLARYDDGLNDVLEEWERRTRDKFGRLGIRDPGSEYINDENIRDLFRDERWDAEKMVKTFARMGAVGGASMVREKGEDRPRPGDEQIDVFTLSSLTVQKWETFRSSLEGEGKPNPDDFERLSSETESWDDVTQSSPKERGVVVDVGREIRIKLYKGQLFMGWFWFVPAFHMISSSEEPTKLLLARKEIDFPLGLGSAIIDVEIQMEWLSTEYLERSDAK